MAGNTLHIFLTLLRAGLHGQPVRSLPGGPQDAAVWAEIYNMALAQTVSGQLYTAILTLPQALMPPRALLLKWAVLADATERHNKKVAGLTAALVNRYTAMGAEPLLLKGQGMAYYYPSPLLRSSGDVDLYFNNAAGYTAAKEWLNSQNIAYKTGDFNSIIYNINGVVVEHHTKLIDNINPLHNAYLKKLEQQYAPGHLRYNIAGCTVAGPAPLLAHVLACTHILKHYLGFGIGMRQLADLAMLCAGTGSTINGSELQGVYSKLGMLRWVNTLHAFTVTYLGLPPAMLPFSTAKKYSTAWLLNDVMQSGNFGFYDKRSGAGGGATSSRLRNNVISRVVPHIWRGLYLAPAEAVWYPVYKTKERLRWKR